MEGFIGVHVGAGHHSSKLHSQYKKLCRRACNLGVVMLREGKSAMDVSERVTCLLEDSPLTNAGLGSSLTWDGKVECDASVMVGSTLNWAGVGAVSGVKNPIRLARHLCDKQSGVLALGRVPPCLLVGKGARKWAMEAGLETVPGRTLISCKSMKLYKHYKKKVTQYEGLTGSMLSPLDTIGVVCVDKYGETTATCSSGGVALKHSGRVGQAGCYGAGVWAEKTNDDCLYSCCTTGCGEHLMKTNLAREVVEGVKTSSCPTSTLHHVIKTKFLESPFLRNIDELLGGVALLKVDKNGYGEFLWSHTTSTMCLGYMSTVDAKPRTRISSLAPDVKAGSCIVVEGTTFTTKPSFNSNHDVEIDLQ